MQELQRFHNLYINRKCCVWNNSKFNVQILDIFESVVNKSSNKIKHTQLNTIVMEKIMFQYQLSSLVPSPLQKLARRSLSSTKKEQENSFICGMHI